MLFPLAWGVTNRVCILLKGFSNELRLGTVRIEEHKVNNICRNENDLVYATVYRYRVVQIVCRIIQWWKVKSIPYCICVFHILIFSVTENVLNSTVKANSG